MDKSEIKYLDLDGARLGYLDMGEGPLLMLVHGFPDTVYTWRHLAPKLVEAGYRVVMPSLRGYEPTGLARDGAYQVGALISDVNHLYDAIGADSDSVIIGHDYGALVAYGAIEFDPSRWRKAVTLAVPPHNLLGAAFEDLEMAKNIYYIFMLPTQFGKSLIEKKGYAFIESLWRNWSPSILDFSEDMEYIKQCLPTDEHRLAITHEYFKARQGDTYLQPQYAKEEEAFHTDTLPLPVLFMHGREDGVLPCRLIADAGPAMAAKDGKLVIVENAGHFLHLDQPDFVKNEILHWVKK